MAASQAAGSSCRGGSRRGGRSGRESRRRVAGGGILVTASTAQASSSRAVAAAAEAGWDGCTGLHSAPPDARRCGVPPPRPRDQPAWRAMQCNRSVHLAEWVAECLCNAWPSARVHAMHGCGSSIGAGIHAAGHAPCRLTTSIQKKQAASSPMHSTTPQPQPDTTTQPSAMDSFGCSCCNHPHSRF